jgi:serine/threonine protein phosphatase PrpC
MSSGSALSIGQYSDRGEKETNQDFHGAVIPDGAALSLKGVAVAIADGISTSPVSHVAAQVAVNSFLTDYYCTSDAWAVETAAQRVISATNAWLHAETRRRGQAYDLDRGYVCTLSVMVLKARTAHLFHVGDSRIFRISGESLEPLTEDHRVIIAGQSYLGRALGMTPDVAIDYRTAPLAERDVFVLCTDGVHEHIDPRAVTQVVKAQAHDLDGAARLIAEGARARGSLDNLTVQIVRIDALPQGDGADFIDPSQDLPPPPILDPPVEFEGYRVVREIHASHRSHIYQATDLASGQAVTLKIPALELRSDPLLLRKFMMEEWVARRVQSPHLLKVAAPARPRKFLYVVTEQIEGTTLRQWMYDNPKPELEAVRGIVEQLVKGVRAMHRKEMVHSDLRPENVMIDREGLVKIIDFGSTRVAGVVETGAASQGEPVLGSVQYTAPECLAGEPVTWRSDLFSLGVIAYEMLTGRLPYGAQASRVRTRADMRALLYTPASDDQRRLPAWADGALRIAVHPDPSRRYEALSEFVTDLRAPNSRFARRGFIPLAERDPARFWQAVSLLLACIVFILLYRLFG